MKAYKQHGGSIANRPFTIKMKEDIGEAMNDLYQKTKEAWKAEPQLLVIIVPSKDAFVYLRIKKSADCRFGVPSQVLQSLRCIDNRPQYNSNVLMKVNAKLGGVTNRIIPTSTGSTLRPRSIIIGADVTHPALGVWTPSLAAMCISNDTNGVSYMGGCQCNGTKVEIITKENIKSILGPLIREWYQTVGKKQYPKQIYYFRDGVSDSEISSVLNKEVPAIRKVVAEACKEDEWRGKLCVVIANKRHHLRAFPNPKDSTSDRNGNPLPGTLIDREVTSPHGWDFLLYAHAALQGTARPVHYKVVLDEIGHKPEELENMIYEQSYQYVRSTTPVSIHPAIYYSHLITARARHHENVNSSDGPQSGGRMPHERSLVKPERVQSKLLSMRGSSNNLPLSMWWV
jgi:eukaryotic translation initiation factor 2C